MTIEGTKVPMVRGANGFVTLEDDDLLENSLQFFVSTYGGFTGTTGEVPWDHRFGTPAEGLRHRNIRSGLLERWASITSQRVKSYMGTFVRLTSVERHLERTGLWMRLYWRSIKQAKERETDVQFSA